MSVVSYNSFHGVPLPILVRREETEDIKQIEVICKKECTDDNCIKDCDLQTEYLKVHVKTIDTCQNGCNNDSICENVCFFRPTGLKEIEIQSKYQFQKIQEYCNQFSKNLKCIAAILQISEKQILTTNKCVKTSCLGRTDFITLQTCTAKCWTPLTKPLETQTPEELITAYKARAETSQGVTLNSKFWVLNGLLVSVYYFLN